MKTAFVALTLVVLPAVSFGEGSLRAQMEALNKPINSALMHRDMKAFEHAVKGCMTPDFKYIDDGSKPMSMSRMVAGMKMGLAGYQKITKVETKVISVKEMGDSGRAVELHTMAGLMAGPDKKPHKMVYVGTATETFRKVKGKWMMASMSMKTDKMTLDGKPMAMGQNR